MVRVKSGARNLGAGQFYTPRSLLGPLGDSPPDRWGRTLMKRAEARRAQDQKTKARTLYEVDYLLLVNDETRQGALRFADKPEGNFLTHGGTPIPPLINLPKLLSATDALLEDAETTAELKLLFAPGSSLGGAPQGVGAGKRRPAGDRQIPQEGRRIRRCRMGVRRAATGKSGGDHGPGLSP